MARLFVVASLLLLPNVLAIQLSVTPVEKVITLLKMLKREIGREGKTEARSYDDFACFCKDLNDKKSQSITSGRDNIDSLSADIEQKTAKQAEDEADLADRKIKHEEETKELAKTKADYAKEKAAYTALAADLAKAIASLESAIAALEAAKPASFLAVKSELENTLALADALNMKVSEPKTKAVTALLQVDPLDPTYKYRSGGIIGTLKGLLTEFRQKKKDADDEWAKAEKVFKDTIKGLEDFLAKNQKAMDDLEANILKLKGEIAQHRIDLVNAEATLKDDQLYLKDLTTRCEARANDWDQRTQLRADEIEALSGALTLLQDNVSSADSIVNERAMLQTQKAKTDAKQISLLQESRVVNVQHEKVRAKDKLSTQARQAMVVSLLGGEGRRLGSLALSSLAMKLGSDPFTKIKKLIQDLIERLLDEATAESTKKGFCDESLGKATQDRDYRLADANALNNELEQLEIKQDELEEEINVLTADIDLLKRTLANATAERKDEHDENMQTIATADEGLKAVNEATEILRSFYKEAAKVEVGFVQASPVDEDTDGAGFKGNYGGKRKASKGIIGMLEVIITDFERTLRVTKAAEAKAHADFVLFDRASKADISGKEMKKELDEQDLKTTIATIAQKMNDLQTAMDRLDAALKKIEALKPTCIDTGMSYEERVSKRDEEIAALKKALCILDEDGVEASCGGR